MTKEEQRFYRFGFIAAQIAVVLPLLAVAAWIWNVADNFFGYTHPADFQTWEPIFNPIGSAKPIIAQHWAFDLQLLIAWFAAIIWQERSNKLHHEKQHWIVPGMVALFSLFPAFFCLSWRQPGMCGYTYAVLSFTETPLSQLLFVPFFVGCHFQSWLTLLYAHPKRHGVGSPVFGRVAPLAFLGTLPLAAFLLLSIFCPQASYSSQVNRVLNANWPIDIRTKDGQTMLHQAAYKGQEASISLLIRRGANLNALSNGGYTPLSLCLTQRSQFSLEQSAQYHCAITLLRAGADVYSGHYGSQEKPQDPLFFFCKQLGEGPVIEGDDIVLQELLTHADNDKVNAVAANGRTPLHYIVERQRPSLAALLLKHGANPNARDKAGQTPLKIAQEYYNKEMARLLESYALPTKAVAQPAGAIR